MAIAGGATTVYLLQRHDGTFTLTRGTALRDMCDSPEVALDMFMAGRQVRISQEHIESFRRQCEQLLNTKGSLA